MGITRWNCVAWLLCFSDSWRGFWLCGVPWLLFCILSRICLWRISLEVLLCLAVEFEFKAMGDTIWICSVFCLIWDLFSLFRWVLLSLVYLWLFVWFWSFPISFILSHWVSFWFFWWRLFLFFFIFLLFLKGLLVVLLFCFCFGGGCWWWGVLLLVLLFWCGVFIVRSRLFFTLVFRGQILEGGRSDHFMEIWLREFMFFCILICLRRDLTRHLLLRDRGIGLFCCWTVF